MQAVVVEEEEEGAGSEDPPLGPYRRPVPRVLGGPRGVGVLLWARCPCTGGCGVGGRRVRRLVGVGVRMHPENARMSSRRGVQQCVAQCVADAALTLVVC